MDIGDLVQMANSQISRIENEQIDLTLSSAVKLAYALDVTLLEIANGLGLKKHTLDLLILKKAQRDNATVTIDDIEALLAWYTTSPPNAKNFLYNAFSDIRIQSGFQKLKEESKSWDMVKAAIEPAGTGQVRLPIPLTLDQDSILECYLADGVMSYQDLGLFIRSARQKKEIGLIELSQQTAISYSALRRIETGNIERIKFSDILALDEQFGDFGDVLAIAWNTAQFYSAILRNKNELARIRAWNTRELAIAETLISISRWYKVYANHREWLNDIRSDIEK